MGINLQKTIENVPSPVVVNTAIKSELEPGQAVAFFAKKVELC
jgi:hypothetical protein